MSDIVEDIGDSFCTIAQVECLAAKIHCPDFAYRDLKVQKQL